MLSTYPQLFLGTSGYVAITWPCISALDTVKIEKELLWSSCALSSLLAYRIHVFSFAQVAWVVFVASEALQRCFNSFPGGGRRRGGWRGRRWSWLRPVEGAEEPAGVQAAVSVSLLSAAQPSDPETNIFASDKKHTNLASSTSCLKPVVKLH